MTVKNRVISSIRSLGVLFMHMVEPETCHGTLGFATALFLRIFRVQSRGCVLGVGVGEKEGSEDW